MQPKSVWDGDGIDEDPEAVIDAIFDLGLMPDDLRALAEHNKGQGWVWERTARYEKKPEEKEKCLEMSRWFWRRAQRFKELADEEEQRCNTDD